MNPKRVKRALEIVDGAHGLSERELDAYLDQVCGEHSLLRREVLDYLDVDRVSHRYDVGEEIARGGQTVVRKAFDKNLRRQVAVKVLTEEASSDPWRLRQFHLEAHIGGQLQHPGIAPVYEIGQLEGGRPYMAMKLVCGKTFDELLAGRTDVTDEQVRFLGVFEQICHAIGFAHSRGVVNGELRTRHVIVGEFGEVQVMEWGSAKLVGDSSAIDSTSSTSMCDQKSSSHQKEKSADVFALGAILFEILTGEELADPETADQQLRRTRCDLQLAELTQECLQQGIDARTPDAETVAGRISSYLISLPSRSRPGEG